MKNSRNQLQVSLKSYHLFVLGLHKNEVNVTRHQLKGRCGRVPLGLKEATTPWVIRPGSTALKMSERREGSELGAVNRYL